ncbi:MAG: hypothetical protein QHG94_07450 [Candidatus Methanosuratincola sp.]|nr:hypothetical protein [Candidatus Methanosuratincola sp.]
MKQDNYVLLIVNVKNTGSSTLNLQCILYDSGMNPYTAGGAQVVQPHGTASFVFESSELGSNFLVGTEYRIDVNDANYGRMAEVRVFCMGR